LLASSAKARDVDAAAIRLWDVRGGKCVQVLSGGHKSTVATLSFSPDGQYLASSGKDRRLCLWKRHLDETSPLQFRLAWAKESAHKRIIWSVHFCPFDETVLASGSRDGCVKLWKIDDNADKVDVTCFSSFAPSFIRADGKVDAVTALSFAPRPLSGVGTDRAALALGLESGRIELWSVPFKGHIGFEEQPPADLGVIPAAGCHIASVSKLAWRSYDFCEHSDNDNHRRCPPHYLASSSMDHACHVYQVQL